MKATLETSEVIAKHAEMIASNKAKVVDGYVQLYLKKKPWWLPSKLYRWILSKVLVLAYFRES